MSSKDSFVSAINASVISSMAMKSGSSGPRPSGRKIPTVYVPTEDSEKPANLSVLAITRQHPIALSEWNRKSVSKCKQCIHWKSAYDGVLEKYKEYRLYADVALESRVANAEDQTKKEHDRLLQINRELKDANQNLMRRNSSLEQENKTIREELDDAQKKLEKKTSENDSLLKKIDGSTMSKPNLINRVLEQQSRLLASNRQVKFHKDAISELILKNETLAGKIQMMTEVHEEEIREMKGLLVCVYNCCIQEKHCLHDKYAEISNILTMQQAYIQEIDGFIHTRDKDNDLVIKDLCDKLKSVVIDGKSALEVIEEKLRNTAFKRRQLESDLEKTVTFLERTKEEVLKQHNFTKKFLDKLCSVIGYPYPGSVTAEVLKSTRNNPQEVILEKATTRKQIEEDCNSVLFHIVQWKKSHKAKIHDLHNRILELQSLLKTERMKTLASNEALKMMNKSRVLKKRKRLTAAHRPKPVVESHRKEPVVVTFLPDNAPSKQLPVAKNVEQIAYDPTVNQLFAKHIHFGKILSTVSVTNPPDK